MVFMLMLLGLESPKFCLSRTETCHVTFCPGAIREKENEGQLTHLSHNPVVFWGKEHPDIEVKLISQRGVIVVGITRGRRLWQLQYLLIFEYEEENAFRHHNSKLKQHI